MDLLSPLIEETFYTSKCVSRKRRVVGVDFAVLATSFLHSLWRRANARNVRFETIHGGQFRLVEWEALVDTVGIKIADSKDTFL